jgi:DNA-binding beta-propeller fold protein YncE
VANFDGNSVTKLQASDGSLMGTYTVGVNPYGIAFDGTHIWTANESSNTVSKR